MFPASLATLHAKGLLIFPSLPHTLQLFAVDGFCALRPRGGLADWSSECGTPKAMINFVCVCHRVQIVSF